MKQTFFQNKNFFLRFLLTFLFCSSFALSVNAGYYCPSDGEGGKFSQIYNHYIVDVVKHGKTFTYVNQANQATSMKFEVGFRGGCQDADDYSCSENSEITRQAIEAWKKRLIKRLQGKGITISNLKTSNVVGRDNKILPSIWWDDVGETNDAVTQMQYPPIAEFENGKDARIDIPDGIVLMTGETQDAFGLNTDDNAEDEGGTNSAAMNRNVYFKNEGTGEYVTDYVVPEIRDMIDSQAKKNSVFLEFDVTLDSGTRLLLVDYQFGSDEYPEYVGRDFNDAFGIFVYGGDLNQTYNIARIAGKGETRVTTENIQSFPVASINTVNSGQCGRLVNQNSSECMTVLSNEATYTISNYYLPNPRVKKDVNDNYPHGNMCIHADGVSRRMPAVLDNLTSGETYKFKIAIAERGSNADDTIAFMYKIRTVRAPKLCYDYAYSQNGRYFTEDNNGTTMPRIVGDIKPNDDINVTLYIRGQKDDDSDEGSLLELGDLKLNIIDINTTQASYKRDSVFVTKRNEIEPKHIPDSLIDVSDENATNIPIAGLGSQDYIYAYYAITPEAIDNIDMALNATITYDAKFKYPVGGGEFIEIDASGSDIRFGSKELPMCSGEIARYEPEWGTYNVGAKGIYEKHSSTNTYPKFNIPTQVAKRSGEFVLTSHDEAIVDDVPFIKEKILYKQGDAQTGDGENNRTFTVVGVETIDAGKFHDTKASCDESSAATSQRVWIPFEASGSPVSQVNFTTSLQKAIDANIISLGKIKDFFSTATVNTAFRVLANTKNRKTSVGDGGNPIFHEKTSTGKYIITDFDNLIELYDNNCSVKQHGSIPGKIDQVCKKTGMDFAELNECHECLRGLNTINICSRDNFAVRPESFHVMLSDQNQTNKTQTKVFSEDRTGKLNPNIAKTDIATGYGYKIDINATAHEASNSAVKGYTYNHGFSGSESNVTFIWNPSDLAKNTTCYTKNSYAVPIVFKDGEATSLDANISDIGEYTLNVVDRQWTRVDYDPARMQHHKEVFINGESKNVTKFFANGLNTADCAVGKHEVLSSIDPINKTKYNLPFVANDVIKNLNGCNITSDSHDVSVSDDNNNTSVVWRFRDYNLTAHPYKFSITTTLTHGSDRNTSFVNAWSYMSDLDDNATQAIHLESTVVTAQSYLEETVKNFSQQCYAQDVNLSVTYNENPAPNPARELQSKSSLAANKQDIDTPTDINGSNFMSGLAVVDLDINYERNQTVPVNPARVELQNLNATCKNDINCTMQADLRADYVSVGVEPVDRNVTLFFGRVWGDDVTGYSPIETSINYEIYCDTLTGCVPALYGTMFGGANPDDGRWIVNRVHTVNDGNVSAIIASVFPSKTHVERTPLAGNYIVLGVEDGIILSSPNISKGYTDIMQMATNSWLISSNDPSATTSDFAVTFLGIGGWAGQGQLGNIVDENVSIRSYRRMDW